MTTQTALTPEDQLTRGEVFAALHRGPGAFVIPNPWDAGTSRMLTALGFRALATTSAGVAFGLGRRDGENLVSREEALENARQIIAATDLPVAADLENGYSAEPEQVAVTIRDAAAAGLVGGSIEDATGIGGAEPIFDLGAAVERIEAAVEAARALPFPFLLTARCENFLNGRPDLKDTIARLQAYEAAGADVLYAPGLTTEEQIRAVCSSVGRPVNVLAGGAALDASVADLAEWGVRRISLGSNLARAALGAFLGAAEEIAGTGTFGFGRGTRTYAEINDLMAGR